MKAIIVEDEKNVRKGLIQMINTFCSEVQIVGEAQNIKEAQHLLSKSSFDLLFLDIELPDGSGLDLLRETKSRDFQVIFVTAYNQYAIEAFRLSAADYLLKPVNPDHLIEAVKKTQKNNARIQSEISLSILMNNWPGQDRKIILKNSDNMHIVRIKDILYCTADGGYTRFHLVNGEKILTSTNLKEYEKVLSKSGFIRSHHSFLVNYHHIVRFNKNDGGQLVLSEGSIIPVSSRKKEQLLKAMQHLSGA